jgi:hypothetical protein
MNDGPCAESTFRSVPPTLRSDFSHSILGTVLSIVDLDLGNRSVTNDIGNVLRTIECYHQPSFAFTRILYCDFEGTWDGVEWDGEKAYFFPLGGSSEKEARRKLCSR